MWHFYSLVYNCVIQEMSWEQKLIHWVFSSCRKCTGNTYQNFIIGPNFLINHWVSTQVHMYVTLCVTWKQNVLPVTVMDCNIHAAFESIKMLMNTSWRTQSVHASIGPLIWCIIPAINWVKGYDRNIGGSWNKLL